MVNYNFPHYYASVTTAKDSARRVVRDNILANNGKSDLKILVFNINHPQFPNVETVICDVNEYISSSDYCKYHGHIFGMWMCVDRRPHFVTDYKVIKKYL